MGVVGECKSDAAVALKILESGRDKDRMRSNTCKRIARKDTHLPFACPRNSPTRGSMVRGLRFAVCAGESFSSSLMPMSLCAPVEMYQSTEDERKRTTQGFASHHASSCIKKLQKHLHADGIVRTQLKVLMFTPVLVIRNSSYRTMRL